MADRNAQRQSPPVAPGAPVSALPFACRFVLRGAPAALSDVARALAVALPGSCRASVGDGCALLWLGPDELLAIAPQSAGAPLEELLQRTLGAHPHSIVEVSQRQVALQLSGEHSRDLLNGGCPLDLDLTAFPVGMCTRTVFGKAEILLWRTAADTFHIEVWRSFVGYVTRLLAELARE